MAVISGNAKKHDGTAIDYVAIFNWADGKCIAQVVPDASGNWSYEHARTMRVGIAYIADGCAPIAHGAYDFFVTAYKWWRITNIVARTDLQNISVAEIRFINEQGVVSNNPVKGFANSFLNSNYLPANAFDGNPTTFAHCVSFVYDPTKSGKNWAIGYQFDTDVKVTSVSVQMRQDMAADFGQEWQTADIEHSADGVNWFKYGEIKPLITANDISVITVPIIVK